MSAEPPHHVLIVGAGSIGERHLRCFQNTGRAACAFVEVNPELRARIAAQYDAQAFANLESALAAHADGAQRFTAAVVATPAHLHVSQATQLAAAGMHLLIEKPLSTTREGLDALVATVRDQQRIAAVAYVYRAYPALAAMRAALHSGRFGRPVQLVATCGQSFPTYRPAYRETYYTDRTKGGGAIQDALTHVLNAGEWLAGPIDRLVTDAAHQVLSGVGVEDTVHLVARHGGVLANYSLNQHQPANEITLTVSCERGMVRWEPHLRRWRWMIEPDEPWHDEPHEPLERDTPFLLQAQHFLDAVEGKAPPLCTLDEGIQTLGVNLAALASLEHASWQIVEGRG